MVLQIQTTKSTTTATSDQPAVSQLSVKRSRRTYARCLVQQRDSRLAGTSFSVLPVVAQLEQQARGSQRAADAPNNSTTAVCQKSCNKMAAITMQSHYAHAIRQLN